MRNSEDQGGAETYHWQRGGMDAYIKSILEGRCGGWNWTAEAEEVEWGGSGSSEGRSTCETLESVVSKCTCARGKKEKEKEKERSSPIEGQSMAARARRRNISQKMRELERLIPSEKKKKGMRVESVKMLEEAIKYVRFLKAQVEAVEESCEAEGGGASALAKQRLGRLLMSPAIQRNLYTHQCCLRLFIANYSHSHSHSHAHAPPHFTD